MAKQNLEKRIFDAFGVQGSDDEVVFLKVKIHPNTVENYKTAVYQRFQIDLERMIDLFPIFERRLKRDKKDTYKKLRKLARLIE